MITEKEWRHIQVQFMIVVVEYLFAKAIRTESTILSTYLSDLLDDLKRIKSRVRV